MLTQGQLVQQLEQELELHPAHRWGDRKQLQKHRRRREELEQEIEEHQRLLHFRSNRHWDTFLALIEVLRHFGALAGEDGLQPTEVGRTVAALRGDNELWLGLAMISGYLDELNPAELAAVLEAISTEVNRPDLWCAFPPPPLVEEALHYLRGLRRELGRQQEQARVNFPIWWEPELTGLVHAWAAGASWNEVITSSSLDEGDVVRGAAPHSRPAQPGALLRTGERAVAPQCPPGPEGDQSLPGMRSGGSGGCSNSNSSHRTASAPPGGGTHQRGSRCSGGNLSRPRSQCWCFFNSLSLNIRLSGSGSGSFSQLRSSGSICQLKSQCRCQPQLPRFLWPSQPRRRGLAPLTSAP